MFLTTKIFAHNLINDCPNANTEWGALAGIFPADQVTMQWLQDLQVKLSNTEARGRLNADAIASLEHARKCGDLAPDSDAEYDIELELDVSTVRPYISGPNHVKRTRDAREVEEERIAVQKAYIVSCVNSRVDDIAAAADVFRSVDSSRRRVAPGVELYIAAASSRVEETSRERGDWQVLLAAGAHPLPSGCGPCVGLGRGLLEDGEVGISATNRNFKGRMGSRKAEAYLGSPSVVAASAIAGIICGPSFIQEHGAKEAAVTSASAPRTSTCWPCEDKFPDEKASASVEIVPGFCESVAGEVIFCHQDNLDTDGIFAGTHTYKEGLTDEMMASHAMENYDPNFSAMVQGGEVLVGGFNFGCGSSREQAATALKMSGIAVLVAGSFSETYKRNAFNNGLLCLEIPQLVRDLKDAHGTAQNTVRTMRNCVLNFARSVATVTSEDGAVTKYPFAPLGTVAQKLVVAGSLAGLIQRKIKAQSA